MAIARIEVLGGLTSTERRDRLNAVNRALVTALRVPRDDPTVLITELDPDGILLPRGVSDQYTIVQITLFAGRSVETKRALYQGLCTSLTGVGVPLSDILIVLVESTTEDCGVNGGTPASEVDLGFRIDV